MWGSARERCHRARPSNVRDRQGAEAQGKADGTGGEPAAPEPRRHARAQDRRGLVHRSARPAAGGLPGLRPLLRALGLDPPEGPAEQPQQDPRPARDASAHPAHQPVAGLHRRRHEGAGTRQGRAGACAVGPGAAPGTGPQRQADHRRQDPAEHPHVAAPAPMLAERPLHRAAPPPGCGRRLAHRPPHRPGPRTDPRRGPRLQREAGRGPPHPRRPRDDVRGPHRPPGADHPRPVRVPRRPLGEHDARLRRQGPRRLPPAARRLEPHDQIGPHPTGPPGRSDGPTPAAPGRVGKGVGYPVD